MSTALDKPAAPAPRRRGPDVSDETFRLMVEQQGRETEVRKAEIDLRLQELKNNSAHAEKILGAQERDREAERVHVRKSIQTKLLFAGFCVLLLVGLIVAGMYMGKDALISDILKVLGGVVAGALGGYGYSRIESKSGSQDD